MARRAGFVAKWLLAPPQSFLLLKMLSLMLISLLANLLMNCPLAGTPVFFYSRGKIEPLLGLSMGLVRNCISALPRLQHGLGRPLTSHSLTMFLPCLHWEGGLLNSCFSTHLLEILVWTEWLVCGFKRSMLTPWLLWSGCLTKRMLFFSVVLVQLPRHVIPKDGGESTDRRPITVLSVPYRLWAKRKAK